MGGRELSRDSFIRHLPYSAVVKLSGLLDPADMWERFVERIPKQLDAKEEDFEPRFSYNDVLIFAQCGQRKNGSPTREIISMLSMKNIRLRHLIDMFVKAELFSAADYISVEILKGEPVPRPVLQSAPLAPAQQGQAAPGGGAAQGGGAEEQQGAGAVHQAITVVCRQTDNREEVPGFTDVAPPSTLSPSLAPASMHMQFESGFPSAQLTAGQTCESEVPLQSAGSAGREAVEDEEVDPCLPDISLDDIILQEVPYVLLKHITKNFDCRPVHEGGTLLGSGGFGTVYLAQFHNGMKTAVKVLKEEADDVELQFEREVALLSQYRHQNVVHLLAYSRDGPSWCLVYEYMVNGSLEDRLACCNDSQPLTVQQRLSVALGTARGIIYLNNQGLVHRDIKSANVLLHSDLTPKIADVATMRMAPLGTGNTRKQTSVVMGTSAYLAPEAYQFDVSAKLDSFSFGVILLELLTGLPPYDHDREAKDIRTHIDDFEGDPMELVDVKAGQWNAETVQTLLDLSESCNEKKRKRPLVADLLESLVKLEESGS